MTPKGEVTVVGSRGKMIFHATIDTGFDGDVSIPTESAITLGLELVDASSFELADGSSHRELIFSGHAVFQGRRRKVEVLVSDSDEALIGTGLLEGWRMTIDFPTGKIQFKAIG